MTEPQNQSAGEVPPRVYLLSWHCLAGGAFSKVRAWAGKLYFTDEPKGRAKFRKEQLTEYLSIQEHEQILTQARAESEYAFVKKVLDAAEIKCAKGKSVGRKGLR